MARQLKKGKHNSNSYRHAFKKLLLIALCTGAFAQAQVLQFDGNQFDLGPNQNAASFEILNEDMDGLIPFSNDPHVQVAPSFLFPAYTTIPSEIPAYEDGDTAYWNRSASQFTTSGTADNWFTFGPVKIPTGGAMMTWKDRFPAGSIESYEVYVSTNGGHAYNDIDPNIDAPQWDRPIQDRGNAHTGNPEYWTNQSTDLSDFAGEEVYIAFRHHYWNGYLLDLDEIEISESLSSVDQALENAITVYPNPTVEGFYINFEESSETTYTLSLFDMTGKLVMQKVNGYTPPNYEAVYVGIPPLISGLYVLVIEHKDTIISKRLVISN